MKNDGRKRRLGKSASFRTFTETYGIVSVDLYSFSDKFEFNTSEVYFLKPGMHFLSHTEKFVFVSDQFLHLKFLKKSSELLNDSNFSLKIFS